MTSNINEIQKLIEEKDRKIKEQEQKIAELKATIKTCYVFLDIALNIFEYMNYILSVITDLDYINNANLLDELMPWSKSDEEAFVISMFFYCTGIKQF